MNRVDTSKTPRGWQGYTLIEMLVVISVIAILASMIIPISGAVNRAKIRTKARAELEQIATAIDSYKAKRGFYPPDNPASASNNQLYYELSGTTLAKTNGIYYTLNGLSYINSIWLSSYFSNNPTTGQPNVTGLANSSSGPTGDEGTTAYNFLTPGLKATQLGTLYPPRADPYTIIISSVPWPANMLPAPILNTQFIPVCYNSSHPTNNPTSFDLWVDIPIGNRMVRFCNWNREPLNVK